MYQDADLLPLPLHRSFHYDQRCATQRSLVPFIDPGAYNSPEKTKSGLQNVTIL